MIQGVVSTKKPLLSILNGKTQLAVRSITQENIYSNKRLLPYSSRQWKTETVPNFKLRSMQNTDSKVKVLLHPETRLMQAMNLVQMNSSRRRMRFLEKIASWGIFVLKILCSFSPYLNKKITGFMLGTKQIERGIKLGQFILAFGEITYNRKTKKVIMNDPAIIMKSKDSAIREVRKRAFRNSRNLNILVTIVLFMLFLQIRRIKKFSTKMLKKWK